MGKYPTGPTLCSEDSTCRVRVHSLKDAGPTIIFIFWGFLLLALNIFQLKRVRWLLRHPAKPKIIKAFSLQLEPGNSDSLSKAGKTTGSENTEEVLVNMEKEGELHVTGYMQCIFGEFCYYLCCLVSLHWIALFILILFDSYNKCQVGGIDNLCFYGNHMIFGSYDFNANIFFVVWWLSAIWFTTWVINKGKLHNWFRLPCELSEADVVHVWTQDHREIVSMNVYFLVYAVRTIKNRLFPPELKGNYEIITIKQTASGQRYFLFRGQRYLIQGNSVRRAQFSIGVFLSDFYEGVDGLTIQEAGRRLEIVGPNEIPFKPETLLHTTHAELFTLFHVYQLVMYVLWFWNSYLFVASLMTFVVLLSASVTIYTRRRGQFMIAKITTYVTEVEVLRSGGWIKLDSRNLVPGDIVKVRGNWLLPCDLLIIRGTCICDESTLTGEAMPVQKYSAPNNSDRYRPEGHGARHTLFSGTKVLQAGASHGLEVRAIVTATGMATSKGELLSAILYPEKMLFKFDEELPIVAVLLLLYAIVCFVISLVFQYFTGADSLWVTKWLYCMAVINQIMSPLLPVALEVGQLQAVKRLKNRGIYCLNPKRISIAGKIRVFCFDKTGTLTKEGLDFIGVQVSSKNTDGESTFGSVLSLQKGDDVGTLVLHGLASCHALSKFGNEYVGNEVEVKMFQAVGWELIEGTDGPDVVHNGLADELKIVKRYEFDHTRATMSVIVQDNMGVFHAYCKGSFEKIRELSTQETLPKEYLEVARSHALNGCYVLALGYKNLGSGLSMDDVLSVEQDHLEKQLNFVALILFRNELKCDSHKTITALKDGEVRPVMVTGDNAQCGYYIARESSMVAPHIVVIMADLDASSSVRWMPMNSSVDGASEDLSTYDLIQQHQKALEGGTIELAVTGKAFNVLRNTGMMDKLLLFTRIFARFTPADKMQVIKMYRDHGLVLGMCGDGGNDCGALRTAHAGIALSEAEASVVSPFTSSDKSVSSVIDLLCEGRGALHTSFACYKFLIMYGLMFSVFKLCCYWYGIIVCQMDYVFIDGVAVLALGYAMTLSYPEEALGNARPTSSLLGPTNTSSVIGVWLINVFFLLGALIFMAEQPNYVRWPAKYSNEANWWTLGDNWESTVLFFTMYMQFITSAFVFSFGSSFRKNVFNNFFLVVSYGALFILMSFLLLLPSSSFSSLWHVASHQFNSPNTSSPVWISYQKHGGHPSPGMPFVFRFKLWLLILVGLAVIMSWQKFVVEGLISKTISHRYPSKRPKLWM